MIWISFNEKEGIMKSFALSPVLIFLLLFPAIQADSQWSSNPQVNLQICDVNTAQLLQKIAVTSDGGCFISWFDGRSGEYRVYIQRLNAQGVKQFPENGLLVSDNPQNSFLGDYDLKVDAQDNALLVFSDIRNSSGDTIANPFAYKISSTGQFLWGANGVTLTNQFTKYQVWPKIAPLSDGSAAVVWWFINSSERNSWFTMQRISSGGVTQFANPIDVKDPGNKRYQYPDVIAAENGNYIVSWVYGPKDTTGSFVPDNISIFSMKYNSSGNPVWNNLATVYNNTGNRVPIYCVPGIYSDGNGGALYSYFTAEDNVLYARAHRFSSSGQPLFPSNGVEGSTNNMFFHVDPYIAFMNQTNETYMFWTEADAATQDHQSIFGQAFSSNGTRLWGNNGKSFAPLDTFSVYGVSCHAKDTNVVVTYSKSYLNAVTYGFRAGRAGQLIWPNSGVVELSSIASPKSGAQTSMTSSGMIAAAWIDGRNATQFGDGGVYAQNLNFNGSIGPVSINQLSSVVPESFVLEQNYPNPFNGQTVIRFSISVAGMTSLQIFDMLGRRIAEPFSTFLSPGGYSYKFDSNELSAGVYVYRLTTGAESKTKTFTLIK